MDPRTVREALKVDVALSHEMTDALRLWSDLYQNKAPWRDKDTRGLNLAAAIAGEVARLATIEMRVGISGSARADFLATQFARTFPEFRSKLEWGCATGGLVIKPYPYQDKISMNFISADRYFPTAFDADGNITGCIFVDQHSVGDKYYTRLEYHRLVAGGCTIRNEAFKSASRDVLGQSVPLTEIAEWAELTPEATVANVDKLLFAHFRYPLANNIDMNSPLGISCYSRVVDLIEDADKQWADLMWEFRSGQRALFVDPLAFRRDTLSGKLTLPQKRLFRNLESDGQLGDGDLFHEWTPSFREQSLLNGLNAILKRLEYNCGLAYGTLSDPQAVDKTATEIKASKQRTYATVTDVQKSVRSALDQLLWAMDVWTTLYSLAPQGTYEVGYAFDDSVITDHDMQLTQDRLTVAMGAMPLLAYLRRNYGLSETEAGQWITEATAEKLAATKLDWEGSNNALQV